MFLGEFYHKLDAKRRLFIPAEYRHLFTDGAVITTGLNQTLSIYTATGWQSYIRKRQAIIDQEGELEKDVWEYEQLLFGLSIQSKMDKQGRIMISKDLCSYLNVEPPSDVAITGANDHLVVWLVKRWKDFKEDALKRHMELAKTILAKEKKTISPSGSGQ